MRSLTEAPEQELEWLEETIMDPRSQFHCFIISLQAEFYILSRKIFEKPKAILIGTLGSNIKVGELPNIRRRLCCICG